MNKRYLVFGTLLILVGVILGAFGAHGLKPQLSADQLESYKTGVFYQLFHGLSLIVLVLLAKSFKVNLSASLLLMTVGVCLFSFSIYLLACQDMLGLSSISSMLGPITPIGGLLMIISWVIVTIKAARLKIN